MTTTSYTGYSLNVYTNYKPPQGSGMVGRITDNGTAITAVPGLINYPSLYGYDPQVEGFVNGSTLGLATAERIAGTAQTATIFDATTGSALTSSAVTWSSIDNMYGIVSVTVGSNTFLYVLDYDTGRVARLNTSTYAQTGTTWDFTTDPVTKNLIPSGYSPHGQALLNIGGTLYGLFTLADSTWQHYSNSVLVKFTVSATGVLSVGSTNYNNSINKNAYAMAVNGSNLYIACIGGAQAPGAANTNSSLDEIAYGASNLSTATITQPVTYSSLASALGTGYEIRDISFNGSTAYVLVGSFNSSWAMAGYLLQTTVTTGTWSGFTTINNFSGGASGFLWAAQYIDNNRILFSHGDRILYYTASSTPALAATFLISDLQSGSTYTTLNDISYVGSKSVLRIQGYKSPTQISRTPRGVAARAIAKGRPELSPDEREELEKQFAA